MAQCRNNIKWEKDIYMLKILHYIDKTHPFKRDKSVFVNKTGCLISSPVNKC